MDATMAAEQFERWVFISDPVSGAKRVSNGLVKRRRAERRVFLGDAAGYLEKP